ncbi:hypothetical protein IL252_15805 [Halomicrobium sp. IBSBa]|uniref:hypothetical protein n=1 Tax=Halomicrobium sp. IBSBa TaxID=2778916 RepID=UPI001ABFEE08|nr:hypothetical protein [Halomicrobium sp. IBSBa]MBO4249280.1 hypothetical protein [Halomicrobium sp. IBSBa]
MDDVRDALYALAVGTLDYINESDDTKYGPIAREEKEFIDLVKNGNYDDVLDADLQEEKYAEIKKQGDKRILIFDTDNIPEVVLQNHSETFQALHKRCNGFAIEHRRGIARVMNEDKGLVDEVFRLWEDRIPSHYLPVLEEALILRALELEENLHQQTVYQWRREISDNYANNGRDPNEAQNLISLCSTGYLDEGNVFDNMYTDMVENGTRSKDEFKDVFSKYVDQNPFAVFVRSRGRSTDKICGDLRDKLDVIHEWEESPGFVELCGKGENTHNTIIEVRNEIESDFDGKMRTRRNPGIDQIIVMFEPFVT